MNNRLFCKPVLTAVFVGILLAGCLEGKQPPKQTARTSPTIPADEYEVFAAALDHFSGDISYVVIDSTSKPRSSPSFDEKTEVPDELIRDFDANNAKPHRIEQRFPKSVRVTLMTEAEHDVMFSGCFADTKKGCGWLAFYEKYGHGGMNYLSRAGFNKSRDMAAVCVSNVRGPEAGGGACLLLAKKDGVWKVVSENRTWIS